jgi:hypothetical protein
MCWRGTSWSALVNAAGRLCSSRHHRGSEPAREEPYRWFESRTIQQEAERRSTLLYTMGKKESEYEESLVGLALIVKDDFARKS